MPIKPPPPRYAQHPFEVCITVSFVFSCLSLALFGPQAGNASNYPQVYQLGLALAVMLGSVLVLCGAYWRDVIMGAFLELAGLVCMSGFIATWLLGVSTKTDNWSSGLAACSLASILVACLWRSTQIVKWIHWIYKEHPPEFWENRALKAAIHRDAERLRELEDLGIVPPAEVDLTKDGRFRELGTEEGFTLDRTERDDPDGDQ